MSAWKRTRKAHVNELLCVLAAEVRSLRLRVWATGSADADTLVVVESGPLERTPERVDTAGNEAGLMSATIRGSAALLLITLATSE